MTSFIPHDEETANQGIIQLSSDSVASIGALLAIQNVARQFDSNSYPLGDNAQTPNYYYAANEPLRIAVAYDAAELKYSANTLGLQGIDAVYTGTFKVGDSIRLISTVTSPKLIRNVRRYNLSYQDAKDKIDFLMGLP